MILTIEVRVGQDWVEAGRLGPGDPAGSMSNNTAEARELYVFGLTATGATIWRSDLGLDMEVGPYRSVTSARSTVVADLVLGDSFEMTVKTDQSSAPRHLRFRVQEGAEASG